MKLERDTILSGRYSIRALLGKGGMGVVYRARDEQLGRQVAIKTIQGDRATDSNFLKRFRREAIAISQIEHPHIVRLFEFVEPAGQEPPYMVMELLSGQDLGTVIRKSGPLDVTRAITRTLESSVAIGECHRYGYLHRDVKPQNIFLHVYNQVETAKVLDFGAVKQEEARSGQVEDTGELTRKGTFLGTPYYNPPEQIAGKPATTKSDQYCLAVVLYTALAGRRPFELKGKFKNFELLQMIMKGEFTPVQETRPEVPSGVAEAIHKAMSLNPDDRFPDLHAFGAALRPYASPQARLTWEAHFTSSAPIRREVHMSIAISASGGSTSPVGGAGDAKVNREPTFMRPDITHGMGPTVRGGYADLTTPQQAESSSGSLSIEIDEASHASGALSSTYNAPSSSAESPARSLLRDKPVLVVSGAIVALGAVLLTSFLLTHRREPAPLVARPPEDLFNRPTVAAAPVPAPAAAPKQPHSTGSLQTLPSTAAATPAAETPPDPPQRPTPAVTASTAPPPKHRFHKRKARPALDPHGIPIPTD